MEQPIPSIFVTGALVLVKGRHAGTRQPIVIHIERTPLHLSYWAKVSRVITCKKSCVKKD
ncbi:conserved protein of unknown function (plasmid) [Vibrio tapetis subsp. tapetis]|uniref:Uncharacterized protein n=2 Tax=Vibrio tapetis TaxID=52443 RepID=A0A2N8ZNS5_9VIBR|nr:hypothetical protein pVT1_61 [Vibrio tapetis]SON53509.1 conserved protein of unknown function [Vibrio tapetis subsp. tapetis]